MNNLCRYFLRGIVLLCFLTLTSAALSAQNKYNKYESSFNYQKGMEAIDKEDYAGAVESMNKELQAHPSNGYAYMYLGYIYGMYSDYGKAHKSINTALALISKKDKPSVAFCYNLRGDINNALEMYKDALADYSMAIKTMPKQKSYLLDRAQFLYEQEMYDYSDADYAAVLKMDENDKYASMGIGRNRSARGEYKDAIQVFDYVIARYSDFSRAYSFRAEAYGMLKDYVNMATDVVKAIEIDRDDKAFRVMMMFAEDGYAQLTARLKAKAISNSNDYYWPYCVGLVNELCEKYDQAAEYYAKSAAIDPTPVTYARLSNSYEELGRYEEAMDAIDKAIAIRPEDSDYLNAKANIYWFMGRLDSAIQQETLALEADPESYFPYHRRGWFKFLNADYNGAVDDFTMALALNPDNAYTYFSRGHAYEKMNEQSKARDDFRACVQRDTIPGGNSCAEFAYFHLGQNAKAIEFMDKLLADDREGNLYDAACLYSLMGHKEKSVSYLQEAVNSGAFKNFRHMVLDSDLDNIRDTEAYQEIVRRYIGTEDPVKAKSDTLEEGYEYKVSEIPFTRANGVTKVKCTINDLPLQFIFDTGASSVSISSLEATFMFKNDFITQKDIVGKTAFMDANGDISIGTVINLRNVTFAGMQLENVKASVVSNDKAPLLLGQSVLSRLGKVEIDYEKSVIRITSKVKK